MLKYSKENVACKLLSTFNIKGELKARIQEVHTDKVHVVSYFQFMTGDFSVAENDVEIVKEDTHVAVVAEVEAVQAFEEPKAIMIKATTPKGKTMKFELNNIQEFCAKHKLDVQAVEAVLSGTQKTHKKWGFVEVE